jgi:hypothetical protein
LFKAIITLFAAWSRQQIWRFLLWEDAIRRNMILTLVPVLDELVATKVAVFHTSIAFNIESSEAAQQFALPAFGRAEIMSESR